MLHHLQHLHCLDVHHLRRFTGTPATTFRQNHYGLYRRPLCRIPLRLRQRIWWKGPDQTGGRMQSSCISYPGNNLNSLLN